VELLLKNKAFVNAVDNDLDTPFHLACLRGKFNNCVGLNVFTTVIFKKVETKKPRF